VNNLEQILLKRRREQMRFIKRYLENNEQFKADIIRDKHDILPESLLLIHLMP